MALKETVENDPYIELKQPILAAPEEAWVLHLLNKDFMSTIINILIPTTTKENHA